MTDACKTFCLVDASGYVFRAYHAIRHLTNARGMATNAIYGYVTMLLKAMKELSPSHVAVVLDPVGRSFRHEMYPEYKANRPPAPPDLKEQFPYIEPVTEALGFPAIQVEGFEADDIIATLARRYSSEEVRVVVVSADKDLTQLVDERVKMYDPMRDKWWDAAAVEEKFGVPPQHIVDLLAIMGDSSDNVPGIKGIGAKGAAKLIQQYGALEQVLEHTDAITAKRQQNALREYRDMGLLSKELVTLRYDVEVPVDLAAFEPRPRDVEALRELFSLFDFKRMLKEVLPRTDAAEGTPKRPANGDAPAPVATVPGMPAVQVVDTREELVALAAAIAKRGRVSLDTETTSTRPVAAKLVGISAAVDEEHVYYIPIAHRVLDRRKQLSLEVVREVLGPVIADPQVAKVGQNFKYDTVVLRNHGFAVAGLDFDTMLASYLLDPGRRSHSLDNLAAEFLGVQMTSYKEVTGSGSKQVTFDYVAIPQAAHYAGEDAWATLLLADRLQVGLAEAGLEELLYDLELPLSDQLAHMELAGVCVDEKRLHALSEDYAMRLESLEKRIYEAAGVTFNLNSPKQLSEVLFERLGLKPGRKTKTGYSTDVRVLEELALEHEVPALMLEHRSLAKLKSTYADVLPTLVNAKTGRIHSSFNQAVTATGRLSSSDPNLQNIPIRGDEGKKIRAAFVPARGKVFLAADYSQVELRVMAHLARDRTLIAAFRNNEDIHSRTASEIFGVPPEGVSGDMRRVAKTINFGIIYGMSAFRLARDQQIPVKQAQAFIDRYFDRYQGVQRFLELAVEDARSRGYAETMLRRRRYLPDLKARNHQVRSMAERMAINTPVQGGAADIMKLAMLALQRRLDQENLPARILLQVHDELVLEVDPEAADRVAAVVRETMEGAYALDVPLRVDIGIGANWAEVHG